MDLVGPACIVAQSFDAAVQVNEERLQKGLSSVQSLQCLDNNKITSSNKHKKKTKYNGLKTRKK